MPFRGYVIQCAVALLAAQDIVNGLGVGIVAPFEEVASTKARGKPQGVQQQNHASTWRIRGGHAARLKPTISVQRGRKEQAGSRQEAGGVYLSRKAHQCTRNVSASKADRA